MKNVKIWQVLLCVVLLGSVPAQAQFILWRVVIIVCN